MISYYFTVFCISWNNVISYNTETIKPHPIKIYKNFNLIKKKIYKNVYVWSLNGYNTVINNNDAWIVCFLFSVPLFFAVI